MNFKKTIFVFKFENQNQNSDLKMKIKIENLKNKCFLKLKEKVKKNPNDAKKCLKFLNKLLKAITEVKIVILEVLENENE